ncbi:YceD family protein [Algoriphagus namhaensis]|uniref:YceD family protein n=1 Tax=Algoriphagus namhaensis TaxID=915353 RepID=A0ABV8AXC5_9BACT
MDKFFRTFDIEVIKYNVGVHEIDFTIDDQFFSHFEDNEIVDKGDLAVRVKMDIGANLIEVDFEINGQVELTCDRSLEKFDYPLDIQQTMIYKFGGEEKEINEDVYMITRDTPSINIAQLLYEFILLAIPTKRIHPDYKNELDNDDPEIQGGFIIIERDEENEISEEEQIDPRWASLKNLKK